MADAGSSITLTSLANFFAFLAGSLIPLPAVTAFCQQAAAVVAFNYAALMLVAPSLLVLHAHLSNVGCRVVQVHTARHNLPAGSCCTPQRGYGPGLPLQPDSARDFGGVDALPGRSQQVEPAATAIGEQTSARSNSMGVALAKVSPPSSAPQPRAGCCGSRYARTLLKPNVKLAVVGASVLMMAVCLIGATLVEDGLDLGVSGTRPLLRWLYAHMYATQDVAPAGSPEARFIEQRFKCDVQC